MCVGRVVVMVVGVGDGWGGWVCLAGECVLDKDNARHYNSSVYQLPASQGGRTRLPKFKFWAKFPIGLHVILQIQIKKFENDCYIM